MSWSGLEAAPASRVMPWRQRLPITWRLLLYVLLPLFLVVLLPSMAWRLLLEGPRLESVRALDGMARISRDEHGIPTISAGTDRDAFFALGYVHARARLWQMEFQRRYAAGRLSEVFGRTSLSVDQFSRTLDFRGAAQRDWQAMAEPAREVLRAYASGVNHWLGRRTLLPVEFHLFAVTPEPWTPLDSLSWIKVLSFTQSGNYENDLQRLYLLRELGSARAAQFIPGAGGQLQSRQPSAAELAAASDAMSVLRQPGPRAHGSNAWVVSGKLSASGVPILANDPHLAAQAPSLWFLCAVRGDRLAVRGGSFPGVPYIVSGRNERLAWGVASFAADSQDLFVERTSPVEPDAYELDGAWQRMEVTTTPIRVRHDFLRKNAKTVTWSVRRTVHGPVISDVRAGSKLDIALAWGGLTHEDRTFEAFLALNYAQSVREALEALQRPVAASLDVLFADLDGHIGSKATGLIPLRGSAPGVTVNAGWEPREAWGGYIPSEQLPMQLDPPEGIIVSANHAIQARDYPHPLGSDFQAAGRAQRITTLLRAATARGRRLTEQDMQAVQRDEWSALAASLAPGLRAQVTDARADLLARWDHVAAAGSSEALLFHAWLFRLERETLGREVSASLFELMMEEGHSTLALQAVEDALQRCDAAAGATPDGARSQCQQLFARTFADAWRELQRSHGRDAEAWQWSDVHRVRFTHLGLGEIPLVKELVNRSSPGGGDNSSINLGPPLYTKQYRYTAAVHPGYRQIIDLGSQRNGYAIAPGQSGNPFSAHYDALLGVHRALQYLTLGPTSDQDEPQPNSH